jgi:hypothetical protein
MLRHVVLFALSCVPLAAQALHPTPAEIREICANAEGAAHCGRLVETVQIQRLPGLARRDGANLLVSLYPQGTATFTDVDDPLNARSYSLWDSLDAINAVLIYTTTSDATTFTLLQRRTNRRFVFPAEPVLAPDRQRLVTADVCSKDCSNEIVVWKLSGDAIARELAWKVPSSWSDAAAAWKDADTLRIEYSAGAQLEATVERKLSDTAWIRVPPR